jgi:hypothetical protein
LAVSLLAAEIELPEHVKKAVVKDSHEQPGLVRGEGVTTDLVPAQRILAPLDPVLYVAAAVAYLDHLHRRELRIGDDKPDPGKKLSVMPLDLGNLSPRSVPSLCSLRRSTSLI